MIDLLILENVSSQKFWLVSPYIKYDLDIKKIKVPHSWQFHSISHVHFCLKNILKNIPKQSSWWDFSYKETNDR